MPKATNSAFAALKGQRKTDKNRESAVSYLRADSQSTWTAPVVPKYRALAAEVSADPRKFTGSFVPLIDIGEDGPEDFLEIDTISSFTVSEIESGFREHRREFGGEWYVVLYERVSTDGQALEGKSLPAMFRKGLEAIHRLGAKVAGIAIDVDGGDEDQRPALAKAMDWIHNRNAHCLLVPVPNRIDRDEVNFGVRMRGLDSCESWMYYGRSYGDLRMSALVWRDIPTRERPVMMVRSGEQYLQEGRAGVAATNQWKLDNGWLASAAKRPNFCFYGVKSLNEKNPNAERELLILLNAKREYEEVRDWIRDAVEHEDSKCLEKIANEFGKRRCLTITVNNLIWELRVGWIVGVNQVSPNSNDGLYSVIDWLALEEDVSRYEQLLSDVEFLVELVRRKRNPKVRANDVDEFTKAKIAEIQDAGGERIAFRLTCNCTSPPTPVESVGPAEENDLGFPRDWVRCPSCNEPVTGAPGKKREPGLPLLRKALSLPDDGCCSCGLRTGLYKPMKVRIQNLEIEVWECRACVLPAAALGGRSMVLEEFDVDVTVTADGRGRDVSIRSLMDF